MKINKIHGKSIQALPAINSTDIGHETYVLNDTFILNAISSNSSSNDRNPVSDWFISIVRPTTPATQIQLDPPEECDDCS